MKVTVEVVIEGNKSQHRSKCGRKDDTEQIKIK